MCLFYFMGYWEGRDKKIGEEELLLMFDLLYVVHVQPVLPIQIRCHFLQVNASRRDPITSSETGITWS